MLKEAPADLRPQWTPGIRSHFTAHPQPAQRCQRGEEGPGTGMLQASGDGDQSGSC